MTIGVDFDGTIVRHRYPQIGEEIPGAIQTLKKLAEDGHRLILWTVREGDLLEEAVQWCLQRGIVFYAVNKDYPEETTDHLHYSRKLKVDLWIDDRNLGGLPSWEVIYRMISSKRPFDPPSEVATLIEPEQAEMMARYQRRKKGAFSKLFGR